MKSLFFLVCFLFTTINPALASDEGILGYGRGS